MAKEKPEKKDSITVAIKSFEEQKKEILSNTTNIELIEINKIHELKLSNNYVMHNRISYSKSKLAELANNIRLIAEQGGGISGTGILSAVILRKKDGVLERICGDNRIKALKINNQTHVPAFILENVSDELARFMRSSENLKREDLNAYDETLSILEHIQIACNFESIDKVKSFINKIKNFKRGNSSLNVEEEELFYQVSAIFEKIGRFDIITFVDRLSLLNMNELIKQALVDEKINYSQAKEINSKLKSDDDINKILKALEVNSLSIVELKKYILNLLTTSDNNLKSVDNNTNYNILKSANKTMSKAQYNKLNKNDKKFVDEKLEKIEMLLNEIKNRVG